MTEMKKPCACDYEACREVWKRVAPGEDPYPMADNANTQMSAQDSELTLPGAETDPCCMGSEASVSVEVLQGFLREELGDAQVYAYLSSCTPRREMARAFRALSEDEKRHARDLAAAIYLITGKAYCPRVCVEQPDTGSLCALAARALPRRGLRRLQLCPRGGGDARSVPRQALCGDERGRIPPRGYPDAPARQADALSLKKGLCGQGKTPERSKTAPVLRFLPYSIEMI